MSRSGASLAGRRFGRWWPPSLLVVTTALSVLLVEAACQVYVRVFLTRPLSRQEFRATRPVPYQRAGYFSADLIGEQGLHTVPSASGTYDLLADVAGDYLNVSNGVRLTTNQPPHPTRRVLVFGGSTVMSEEVPDAYTIPSVLQRMINASCDTSVVVLNFGVSAMTIRQQRARLMEESVAPHDLVVFFDGVNDVYYTIYSGVHEDDSTGDAGEAGLQAHLRAQADQFWMILDRAGDVSALAWLVSDVRNRAVPYTVTDAAILQRSLDRAEMEYRRELVEAHRFVVSAQGEFIHFLQPHLFATPLSTAYRRELSGHYLETPPGLETAFRLGYPRLRNAVASARQDGVVSFDLSGLLAADRVPDDVFLDFAHVNDVANEIVARAMFASIADRIGDCGPGGGDRGQP